MSITVNAVHRRVQYVGNGSNLGAFSFSFKVLAATDIKVSVATTVKTVTTHYTTSLNADGTGSVTFTSGNAPANNAIITIESDQAIERTTDYSTGGDFTAASINDALDRLTINDQQIETLLSRNVQLASTVNRTTSGTGTSGPLFFPYADTVSDQASKLIAYDSNGTALETTTGRVNTVAVSNVAVDGSGNSQSATVSFNSSSGALALGVPVGATGAGGSTGSQGPDGVGGLPYTFSTTTSDSDPGAGQIRLNSGTLGSVSQIFIDDSTAASGNPDVSAFILTWDDSTQTSDRGQVTIVKKAAQQNFATYKISGTSTDASGYVKLVVSHVVSNGSFSNSDAVLVSFVRTGNAGSLDDPMTTRGDIIVRDSSNATARLAVGSANTVLTSDGTDLSYAQVATAMIADDAVTAAKVANDAVVTASIADNAVSLAKLASGTDGNLISFDASGDPAYVTTGSSGQVLTSNGAGAAPTFQAAGGGKVVAFSNTHVATDASTTATFPDDDTPPTSGEGAEYTTFTHTAASATNKILIQIIAQAATSGVVVPVLALFKDSGSTAERTTFEETHGNGPVMMTLQHLDTAGSTSEITYKLRFGSSGNTGTVYLGSQHHSGGRWADTGGVNIQIWELEA